MIMKIYAHIDNQEDDTYANVCMEEVYDAYQDALIAHYITPNLEQWQRWMQEYVRPAYDENKVGDLVLGYSSVADHDFQAQLYVYSGLALELRLDEEARMFIGFMAGAGFFKRWDLSCKEWLNIANWYHPRWHMPQQKSISEILDYAYGLNYLKTRLPQMPFWKR